MEHVDKFLNSLNDTTDPIEYALEFHKMLSSQDVRDYITNSSQYQNVVLVFFKTKIGDLNKLAFIIKLYKDGLSIDEIRSQFVMNKISE